MTLTRSPTMAPTHPALPRAQAQAATGTPSWTASCRPHGRKRCASSCAAMGRHRTRWPTGRRSETGCTPCTRTCSTSPCPMPCGPLRCVPPAARSSKRSGGAGVGGPRPVACRCPWQNAGHKPWHCAGGGRTGAALCPAGLGGPRGVPARGASPGRGHGRPAGPPGAVAVQAAGPAAPGPCAGCAGLRTGGWPVVARRHGRARSSCTRTAPASGSRCTWALWSQQPTGLPATPRPVRSHRQRHPLPRSSSPRKVRCLASTGRTQALATP